MFSPWKRIPEVVFSALKLLHASDLNLRSLSNVLQVAAAAATAFMALRQAQQRRFPSLLPLPLSPLQLRRRGVRGAVTQRGNGGEG